jgi:hypothetical protein
MFYVTTSIDGKITGRILDQKKTQEAADAAVTRIRDVGTSTRANETIVVIEATSRLAVPKEIDSAPVMTDDMQKASILGYGSVMNRDL